jgi:hypothetical protein
MSRGPGKWQRMILERLQQQDRCFLAEILPLSAIDGERHRSAQRAAMRAAHRIAAQGLITMNCQRYGWNHFYWTGERMVRLNGLLVARAGCTIDRWAALDDYQQNTSTCTHLRPAPRLSTCTHLCLGQL